VAAAGAGLEAEAAVIPVTTAIAVAIKRTPAGPIVDRKSRI
jgi:hypothetical protein